MSADKMVFLPFQSVDQDGRNKCFQSNHFQGCSTNVLEEERKIKEVSLVKAVVDFLKLGGQFGNVFLDDLRVFSVNDCSLDESRYL